MSENTKIEWADHTFNPWIGCTKISPACDHCYAERIDNRFGGGHWGTNSTRKRTSSSTWAMPRRWDRQAAERGVRYRVFCASLADVFDNEVPVEWRVDLFELIRRTPNLDWLLLTKRIGAASDRIAEARSEAQNRDESTLFDWLDDWLAPNCGAPRNLWLGATVVNQAEADRDVPKLLSTPARIRFLSIEPMLGPIDLTRLPAKCSNDPNDCCGGPLTMNVLEGSDNCPGCEGPEKWLGGLDWIIAGGESGPQARPSHPDWFRSLRDQCIHAGVPFLFKQWGEWVDEHHPVADPNSQGTSDEFVDIIFDDEGRADDYRGVYMCHVGKKVAGRNLDGRAWDEVPTQTYSGVNI